MDPRVELYKAAFSKSGRGGDIPKFYGSSRYHMVRGSATFFGGYGASFRPIAVKGAQTLLKQEVTHSHRERQ